MKKNVFHKSLYLKEGKHNLAKFDILCDSGSSQLLYVICPLYILNHHNV